MFQSDSNILTDFRLSRWLIIDANSVLGRCVNVGDIANVSEVHSASIFRVEVCRVATFYIYTWLGGHELQSWVSCEPVAIHQGREYGSRGIPIVGSRYLATPGEDSDALMFRAVICKVCRSVKLLWLPVFTSYKCSINPLAIQTQCLVTNTWHISIHISLFWNATGKGGRQNGCCCLVWASMDIEPGELCRRSF
jgi:hypothetical protein